MTSELEKMMEQDAAEQEDRLPTSEELAQLSDLVQQQIDLDRLIAARDKETAELKKRLDNLQMNSIPAAMQSVGLSEFKMADGAKVTIKKSVFASIRADKIMEAVAWLDQNDMGGIVKDEVKVKFGRGEAKLANQFMNLAADVGVSAEEKLSVHPGTLAANVKEMREKGVEFPEEFFSIADVNKAIVKPAKK